MSIQASSLHRFHCIDLLFLISGAGYIRPFFSSRPGLLKLGRQPNLNSNNDHGSCTVAWTETARWTSGPSESTRVNFGDGPTDVM